MNCGELIKYLSRFKRGDLVAIVPADVKNRIYYKVSGYQLIDETPALLLEVPGSGPLDEIAEEVVEDEAKPCVP